MKCHVSFFIWFHIKKFTVSFRNRNLILDNRKQPPTTTCNIQIFALKKLSLDRNYSRSQIHFSVAFNSCLYNSTAQYFSMFLWRMHWVYYLLLVLHCTWTVTRIPANFWCTEYSPAVCVGAISPISFISAIHSPLSKVNDNPFGLWHFQKQWKTGFLCCQPSDFQREVLPTPWPFLH